MADNIAINKFPLLNELWLHILQKVSICDLFTIGQLPQFGTLARAALMQRYAMMFTTADRFVESRHRISCHNCSQDLNFNISSYHYTACCGGISCDGCLVDNECDWCHAQLLVLTLQQQT